MESSSVMARSFVLAAFVLLGACSNVIIPQVSQKPADSELTTIFTLFLPGQAPWQKRCFVEGASSNYQYVMGPTQLYRGVWRRGFETSTFDRVGSSATTSLAGSTWLDAGKAEKAPQEQLRGATEYDVEFLGQEPICDGDSVGGFGHMQRFGRLIVVKRFQSIQERKPI
jgi:hypothetical protein